MPAYKNKLRTEFARAPARHSATYPEGLRFVRGCKHDAAAHGDGLAAQQWVQQLFNRGIEGIKVCMQDGGGRFHVSFLPKHRNAGVRLSRWHGLDMRASRLLSCHPEQGLSFSSPDLHSPLPAQSPPAPH